MNVERVTSAVIIAAVILGAAAGVLMTPEGFDAPTAASFLLLGASTAAAIAGTIACTILYRRHRRNWQLVHMTSAVLLDFVLLGSWASILGRIDVWDTQVSATIAAVGRGALLLLTIYFALLFVGHVIHTEEDRDDR